MKHYEDQYLDLIGRILDDGVWVVNKRTGVRCKTVINADMVYTPEMAPVITSRQMFTKSAIAEFLGYIRGYTNASDFRELGTKTWDANANLTPAWLANPHRKGEDDMGLVYGAVANDFGGENLFQKVFDNLRKGIDDRGEIVTFWKPDDFGKGCLRPCMHTHTFSLLDGTLHLTSSQRSCDVPLGLPFNMIQCHIFLKFMAHVTGHKMGNVYHKIVNAHIYENQLGSMEELWKRGRIYYKGPEAGPKFELDFPVAPSWSDVVNNLEPSDFTLTDYVHKGKMVIPFTE